MTRAQTAGGPLTQQEFVRLLNQLPARPGLRDELVTEVRRRGINFALTSGLRSLVATKSGSDPDLRRTLEEAARRRENPAASQLPPAAEANELLARTRTATLAAAERMPDFVVRQLIVRSYARGRFINWTVADRLAVAVSYRAEAGEEYRVLAVNGLPPTVEVKEGRSYEQLGGTSSTGEYVSVLAALFKEESRAEFRPVDTDLLRGRRAIIYEFEVKRENSRQTIKVSGDPRAVVTGYRGRIWVDREQNRVLRIESVAFDIPEDFPVTAAASRIDYDWVTINETKYLLPSYAEVKLTSGRDAQAFHSRNEIRFRGYQKFGSEVRIIEDIEPDEQDINPPAQPGNP